MSISQDIRSNFDEDALKVVSVASGKVRGIESKIIRVVLKDNTTVEGTFSVEARPGFGGVQFENKYDIAALMTAKIKSVMKGTSEL